jgi:hypothetical protein
MASERQIAANRRNAQNSSGPRSGAGKKRASGNSYRHGLSATMASSAQRAKSIQKLARKLAGDATDVVILEYARDAAQAVFDLAQVRQVKVALIERMRTFGEFDASVTSRTTRQTISDEAIGMSEPAKAEVAMPSTEPERSDEAVRQALPELLKLDRYERRAATLREQSARIIIGRISQFNNLKMHSRKIVQNEANLFYFFQ